MGSNGIVKNLTLLSALIHRVDSRFWSNILERAVGGGGEIRTRGPLFRRTPIFKTGALNHSATPPCSGRPAAPGAGNAYGFCHLVKGFATRLAL